MPYNDFWSFMNRMKRNVTDAQKVDMARRELDNKWLTTEQVNVLLDDIFFEQQKLELAQNLYHRTVDPEKYDRLESQFDFSSNKRKLSEYVERNASNWPGLQKPGVQAELIVEFATPMGVVEFHDLF